MKNILLWIVGVVVVLWAGFFLLNNYIYNEKQADEATTLDIYFEEGMITRGVAEVGQPIEGFDAGLLMMAYPGLVPSDFDGVETFEGVYEIEGEEVVFVRTQTQPITSAEKAISRDGYATLLDNLSSRFDLLITSESQIDELIERID